VPAFVAWMMMSVFGQVIAYLGPPAETAETSAPGWRRLVIGSLEAELFGAPISG
jgi:hypothetical protein